MSPNNSNNLTRAQAQGKLYTSPTGQVYKKPAQLSKYPPTNYVPVVGKTGIPLMPCHPKRARKLMESNKAKPRWSLGSVFYIQLTERETGETDPYVVLGIDPGSKFEGYSVRSTKRTLINIQSAAPTHVKDRVASRSELRRGRRFRNTPCRKNKSHRGNLSNEGRIPPSTRARCLAKINIAKWLMKLYPITHIVIEDISARTKKNVDKASRSWNKSFSPIQVGKTYLYSELQKLVTNKIITPPGNETHRIRIALRTVTKTTDKSIKTFEAHCLDAWVLAGLGLPHDAIEEPDNMSMYLLSPILLHRRQLHVTQPAKGGVRKRQGGTRSMGLTRGSLVHHPKYGYTYVGGSSKLASVRDRITLHDLKLGERLTRSIRPEHCKVLTYRTKRVRYLQRTEMTCKICGKTKPISQKVLQKANRISMGINVVENVCCCPACSLDCYDSWLRTRRLRKSNIIKSTALQRYVASA